MLEGNAPAVQACVHPTMPSPIPPSMHGCWEEMPSAPVDPSSDAQAEEPAHHAGPLESECWVGSCPCSWGDMRDSHEMCESMQKVATLSLYVTRDSMEQGQSSVQHCHNMRPRA